MIRFRDFKLSGAPPLPIRLFGPAPFTTETHIASVAEWHSRLDEDTISSSQPEDADDAKRAERQRRKRRIPGAIFVACMGLFSFSRVAGNPRFETIHTLDVIGLMTAGAGLGVAFVLLIQFFCLPGPRSEDNRAGPESKSRNAGPNQ